MLADELNDVAISTNALHRDERIDFWVDNVARLLVKIECSPVSFDGVEARLSRRVFTHFNACDISAGRHAVVRSPQSIRSDHRDSVFVCLMHEGRGYTFQGVECMLHGPGDVVLYDTAHPYGHGFQDEMAMTVLDIPRSVFESAIGPWRYNSLLKIDHADGVSRWAIQQVYDLLRETPENALRDREDIATCVLDRLRSALLIGDSFLPTTKSTIHTLQRAKKYIEAHLTDEELDCDSISREMKLSPRQLARVFEIEGVPVMRFILSRRLERCRNDLRDPSLRHLSVSEVAFRWGFNNSAHFSRTYRARFGEAPTQTRTSAFIRPLVATH